MNCCNNNNKNERTSKTGKRGHAHPMWMMALCCGAPILILAVISLLGAGAIGTKTFLAGILPFICPVMMLVMIPMMFLRIKRSGQSHEDHSAGSIQIEEKNSTDK